MSNKWKNNEFVDIPDRYICVLFISRNKDNKEVLHFKERKESFFVKDNQEWINRKFSQFVDAGVPGEMCRLYKSVNARDVQKVKKALTIELIQNDNFEINYIAAVTAGIAARKENAAEKRWMFDFDYDNIEKVLEFSADLTALGVAHDHFRTPNGYAVICEHGFDTRELLAKWTDATLKRDDLLCYCWDTKEVW